MAKRHQINDQVLELLWNEYFSTIRYQKQKNDITVTMTFDEYLSLWSMTRITTITEKLARGQKSIDYYMGNKHYRPVCSWVSKDRLVRGGTMTVQDARIISSDDSKKLFQFKAGDKHDDEAKRRIGESKRGKKQTPEQIAKRTASRIATMALKRAEREAQKAEIKT